METKIRDIYRVIKLYASYYIGKADLDNRLIEVCEFRDSYGFLFSYEHIYDNCYWCVGKKDLKLFGYIPKPSDFKNRKIITHAVKE